MIYTVLTQVALRYRYARLRLLFFVLYFPGLSLVSLLSCEYEIRRIDRSVRYILPRTSAYVPYPPLIIAKQGCFPARLRARISAWLHFWHLAATGRCTVYCLCSMHAGI
jgi:hypothetical protein